MTPRADEVCGASSVLCREARADAPARFCQAVDVPSLPCRAAGADAPARFCQAVDIPSLPCRATGADAPARFCQAVDAPSLPCRAVEADASARFYQRANGDALSLFCRAMAAGDVAACAALAAGDPECWSAAALAEELEQPAARLFVGERGGRVIGFAIFQLVVDEASLLAVHTAPDCRRQGVAAALLRFAFRALESEGARTIFLEVRAQNTAALALYEGLGFVRAGLRRRFYRDPLDDAVVMRRESD